VSFSPAKSERKIGSRIRFWDHFEMPNLYSFISCCTLILFVNQAGALFEDQIGKFDW